MNAMDFLKDDVGIALLVYAYLCLVTFLAIAASVRFIVNRSTQ